jgi:hypothetical protein
MGEHLGSSAYINSILTAGTTPILLEKDHPLLSAAANQIGRRKALLEQVGPAVEGGTFIMPSCVEAAKPTSELAWNTDLDKRPISQRYLVSSGKRYEDLNEFEKKFCPIWKPPTRAS